MFSGFTETAAAFPLLVSEGDEFCVTDSEEAEAAGPG
jgi:hypothetical protein